MDAFDLTETRHHHLFVSGTCNLVGWWLLWDILHPVNDIDENNSTTTRENVNVIPYAAEQPNDEDAPALTW